MSHASRAAKAEYEEQCSAWLAAAKKNGLILEQPCSSPAAQLDSGVSVEYLKMLADSIHNYPRLATNTAMVSRPRFSLHFNLQPMNGGVLPPTSGQKHIDTARHSNCHTCMHRPTHTMARAHTCMPSHPHAPAHTHCMTPTHMHDPHTCVHSHMHACTASAPATCTMHMFWLVVIHHQF